MKYLFILIALLLLTSGAFAGTTPPVTTFSSFQVANTTDQNITLTCTDNNTGCKTINYNINNLGWNQYNVKRIDTNTNIDYNVGLSLSGCYNTSYGIKRTDTFSKVIDQNKLLKNLQLNVEMEAGRIGYWYLKIFFADGTTENTEEKNYSGGRTPTNLIFSNFTKTKDFNKIEIWAKSNYASPCADVYTNSLAYRYDTNTLNSYPTYSFLFSGAGSHSIQYYSTDNADNNETIKTSNFTTVGNLIPPTITLTTTQGYGFVTDFNIGVTINCQDDWLDPITYDINLNTDTNKTNLLHVLDSNNQTKTIYYANSNPQQVRFKARCTDGSGNYAEADSSTIYQLLFRLVNEQNGNNVTVADLNSWLTSALVYTYDGNFSFDFNGSGVTTKKFLSPGQQVRFDFAYKDSTVVINRDIDFSLITDTNIPVCLAPPQTFYIQTIYSASTKPIILYSDSTKCYNMVSNTKFALENGLMARAYTISKPYLLKTIINGVTTSLASLDGSLENTVNVDSLQFNQSALDIKIGNDAISLGKDLSDYNIIKFYYLNPNEDSTSTTFVIRNGGVVLFTITEDSTPNEFVANWNYLDANLDRNTVLSMTVSKTIENVVESYTFYFTIEATYYQGVVNEWFALIVAFCLVLFGLTLVAYKHSFGWFGLIMLCAALLITALAPGYWYVRFFQGILLILIIFVGIVFKNETQGAV